MVESFYSKKAYTMAFIMSVEVLRSMAFINVAVLHSFNKTLLKLHVWSTSSLIKAMLCVWDGENLDVRCRTYPYQQIEVLVTAIPCIQKCEVCCVRVRNNIL